MHNLEPFFLWRNYYRAEGDPKSPFHNKIYNELGYDHHIYDFLIHPQWDSIGSETLFVKILYVNYEDSFCFIELIGEWNDCLNSDIMMLKHEIIDLLIQEGVNQFVLIGSNVLNFHPLDHQDYYQEWQQELEGGFIAALDFQNQVLDEMLLNQLDHFISFVDEPDLMQWKKLNPEQCFQKVKRSVKNKPFQLL